MIEDNLSGRVPPSDLDAENVVLGACVLDPECIDKIRAILKPEQFYSSANQRIFESICALVDTGKPVDIVSLLGHLRNSGNIDKIGGAKALTDLLDNVAASSHPETHAETVSQKASVRALVNVCRSLAIEGHGDIGNVSEWLSSADNRVYNATRTKEFEQNSVTIGEATMKEMANLRERSQNPAVVPGITTGFASLDRQIGGWKRGCKYTIAARPGQGKSSLMLNHALGAAKAGHGVVIVSIEMPREQLVLRSLAQLAHVNGKDLDRAQLGSAQWKDLTNAAETLTQLPIIIVDAGSQNPATVRAAVREGQRLLQRKFGENMTVDLVAIDYVQIMSGSDSKAKHQNRENEISEISGANRLLAKLYNCAVLELSQLNREVEKRPDKRPVMSDLRESGSLEQDSFGIIMLFRDDAYKSPEAIPDGDAELLIRKIRQGGSCGTIRVKFDGPTTNFFDSEESYREFDDVGIHNGF